MLERQQAHREKYKNFRSGALRCYIESAGPLAKDDHKMLLQSSLH